MPNQGIKKRLLDLYKNEAFWFSAIIFIAVFMRCFMFGRVPSGINQDEVSIGYDAWALMNYGVDRNLSKFPVHLIAWGSGQNALYAYFLMAFIFLFGLNIYAVRCVNMIFGIASVFAVYFLMKKLCNKKTGFIAMLLTAISPWHISLSRWGLESNLFPALYLIAATLFVYGIEKPKLLLISSAVFSMSLYSYGSAYFVVPVTCLILSIYLIRKKTAPAKYLVLGIAIFVLIAIPILIFLLINKLQVIDRDVNILFFTIPKLTTEARVDTVTNQSINLHTVINSVKNMFKLLVVQDDGLPLNVIRGFGIVYWISIPFTAIGIWATAKRKNRATLILLTWLVCGLGLFFMYSDPNINRTNIIYLPIILITAVGIKFVADKLKHHSGKIIILCYLLCFVVFSVYYFTSYKDMIDSRRGQKVGIDKAIVYAEEISENDEKIYFSKSFNSAYIYVLFYNKISPYEYNQTVKYSGENSGMQIIDSFSKYKFNVTDVDEHQPGIYVMFNDEIPKAYENNIIKNFGDLVVLEIE